MLRTLAVALVATGLCSACRTAPEAAPARPPVPPPTLAVEHLLGPCWPDDSPPDQRVVLTLVRQGHQLADVMFETANGAPNAVGRCLRQVVWLYPWRGDIPDTVELAPPSTRPHGWAVLEHVRLLGASYASADRGVLDPIPLVHACLTHGAGVRPGVLFHAQTSPVRVFTLIQGVGDALRPTAPLTDSERCVQAVLSSTVFPGSRSYTFDFSRGTPPGTPAPFSEVAAYFAPEPAAPVSTGALDPAEAKAALQGLGAQVGACWNAALERRGGLSGGRTLRIAVDAAGKVTSTQVIPDHSGAPAEAVDYLLDRCVAKAVQGARLPPPAGGPAELAYSWVFALRQ